MSIEHVTEFPGVTLQYSLDGETWLSYVDNDRPAVSGEVFVV
ncbi:chitobiase/beta-hexosaminidase C-terminal domain-containing protein [Vibrio sp. YIC-376]